MATSSAILKVRYPWNDANRHHLVEVVKELKGREGKLKWKEVTRRLLNETDLDDSMFGKLCAKQFDNLYRAYMKFKEDGNQPPRLTMEVIEEFDQICRDSPLGGKGLNGDKRGTNDSKYSSPDAKMHEAAGKKSHSKLTWTNTSRLNLLEAVKVSTSEEGKVDWSRVAAHLPDDYGLPEERFSMLCMKQFTDLSYRFKEFKLSGARSPILSSEIIQTLLGLHEVFPNLNPLPDVGQIQLENVRTEGRKGAAEEMKRSDDRTEDRTEVSKETRLSNDRMEEKTELSEMNNIPRDGQEVRSSSRGNHPTGSIPGSDSESTEAPPFTSARGEGETSLLRDLDSGERSVRDSEPSSGSKEAPTPDSGREEAEIAPPRNVHSGKKTIVDSEPSSGSKEGTAPNSRRGEEETCLPRNVHSGKRKERADLSSSQTDMSTHDDHKDEQEVGFDRMEKELLLLKSWLKQEVLPAGKEALARVKSRGRRHHLLKRSKTETHEFDRLIDEASQKSTTLAIRAQFQQTRARILKEVKETIERVGMDLLNCKCKASNFKPQ